MGPFDVMSPDHDLHSGRNLRGVTVMPVNGGGHTARDNNNVTDIARSLPCFSQRRLRMRLRKSLYVQ